MLSLGIRLEKTFYQEHETAERRWRYVGSMRRMVWLAAAFCHAQALEPDALLAQAMRKIERGFDRQRRFTCDAVIARETYGARRRLLWTDRVHVDVAVFEGRQLYSWPGESAFGAASVKELTGTGASGSGEFGPFAASFLADSDPASIRHRRSGALEEFSYEVPLATSHYMIGREATAYQGALFVDSTSGELKRMVIHVPRPPSSSGIERAEIDIKYTSEDGGPNLYPSFSVLTLSMGEGSAVNRTTYRGCRRFTGESTLQFGTEDNRPHTDATSFAPRIPAGIRIRSTMATPVDSRTSSAGDTFEARVAEPVKQGDRTVIPKGALLHGRITRMEQRYSPSLGVLLQIRFAAVEFGGVRYPIALAARLNMDAAAPDPGRWVRHLTPASSGVASIQVFGTDHLRLAGSAVNIWETVEP